MKRIFLQLMVLTVSVFLMSPVLADKEKVKEIVAKKVNLKKSQIKVYDSKVKGIYRVETSPTQIAYITADGKYVFTGDMINLAKDINETDVLRSKAAAKLINAADEKSMIVFGNKTLKHTITVFTDIDCGYCRKLHNEMEDYNKKGIRVRYLSYPRAGPKSDSFKKAESVWCSDDRKAAMTRAKSGMSIEEKKCKSPVEAHFNLGRTVDVKGTPAIFLENGVSIPGYMPAQRLLNEINKFSKK